MVTRTQKYSNRFPKKENIIDLTDTSRNNKMPVVRTLEVNPITGERTYTTAEDRSLFRDPESNQDSDNNNPIFIMTTGEDKGQAHEQPYTPPEIEPQEEERLESMGATIHDSTTYYPASNMSVSKRSQTPQERAEERGYHDFPEV